MAHGLAGGTRSLTIVVVDPRPVARAALSRVVEAAGHEVLGAADAEEAWARIRERPVDVLLADWPVPQGAPVELVLRIRERERVDAAPALAAVLVAHPAALAAAPAAVLAGADGVIARRADGAPDPAELQATLIAMGRLVSVRRRLAAGERQLARLG